MRAWIYLRKSRALGDPDDPKLLEHHHSVLRRLAKENQIAVPPENIIREVGSAETIAGRPRFRAVLEGWERDPRDAGGTFLITELERLSRGSMSERGRIAEALSRTNVEILTPSRRYNLRNSDDMFFFAIVSEMGGHELGKYKERKALKLDELLRRGRSPNGRHPFGYLWAGKPVLDFIPDPAKFPILRAWCEEIFTMSIDRIAAKWGVNPWVVHHTLRNPTICGYPARRTGLHHGEKDWRVPSIKLPRDRWVWPERQGDYETACSREQWEMIQAVLDKRSTQRSKTVADEDGWCRDVVRFAGFEGLPAACDSYTSYPPSDPRRYTYRVRPPGRPVLYIARQPVHEAAEEALRQAFSASGVVSEALAQYRYRETARQIQPAARTVDVVKGERNKKERQLVELLRRELEEESDIQRRPIAQLRLDTERDIQRLTAEIQAVQSFSETGPEVEHLMGFLAEHLPRLGEWWSSGATTGADRKIVVNGFLQSVLVRVEDTGGRSFHREVVSVTYRPWLHRLMEEHRKELGNTLDTRHFPI